ncbi:DUF4249 family protein [Flagellimonas onchidii]|uniref:DUF4249 family protein n=1 Tax=Flagellimonas onchidii TaxID=2562684 RepID=UPI001456101D|nr:DUF4249 family protein [Allomuricauda onchidii]
MRYCLLSIITLGLFVSCEDVINVDLPTSESKLVIDALIGYNENNGNPIVAGEVRLTYTAPFLSEEIPPVLNASVSILDEQSGESFQLLESQPGVFGVNFPELKFNRDYTLVVTHNNQVYTATQQMQHSSIIDKVEQKDGFLFDEEETEVEVTFMDIPGTRSYYLISFGFGNFLVIDDEFFQDSSLTFSYFYEDVDPGDLLVITLFGIDKEFANYASLALIQSGEDGGDGPFSVPPGNVRGNIINTSNPNNPPFGYFAISEFDTELLTLE